MGWVSFNRRPGENVKMQRRLCLEAKSKLPNFSALDVDSADRPSDTNLIKEEANVKVKLKLIITFLHTFLLSTVPGLTEYIEYKAWEGKLGGTTIADVINHTCDVLNSS